MYKEKELREDIKRYQQAYNQTIKNDDGINAADEDGQAAMKMNKKELAEQCILLLRERDVLQAKIDAALAIDINTEIDEATADYWDGWYDSRRQHRKALGAE